MAVGSYNRRVRRGTVSSASSPDNLFWAMVTPQLGRLLHTVSIVLARYYRLAKMVPANFKYESANAAALVV